MDELHDKRRAFHSALKYVEYGNAVTIGSYVGALIAKVRILEKENEQLKNSRDGWRRRCLNHEKEIQQLKKALNIN